MQEGNSPTTGTNGLMDEVLRRNLCVQIQVNWLPIGQSWGYLIDWDQDGGYWTETLATPTG